MRRNTVLWVVQGLLALLFVFAGVMKLVLPIEAIAGPVGLPGPFMRFIGVAEVLGGLGLVLPGILQVRTGLTPVAAGGLVVIMAGATVVTAMVGNAGGAAVPLLVGVLAAVVAYSRAPWHVSSEHRWVRGVRRAPGSGICIGSFDKPHAQEGRP